MRGLALPMKKPDVWDTSRSFAGHGWGSKVLTLFRYSFDKEEEAVGDFLCSAVYAVPCLSESG